jgi:nitroimidazol reductase NimA-like FMN-containing flavoprotein (pyridoxamine 5'-phosphate oxidase superfamily)
MVVHELTTTECRDALQRADLGRLACVNGDQPYIVPIHFSFDAGRNCLYAFSVLGQKIDWMRQQPKVCLAVEDLTDKNHWTTVLVFGRYEELTDSADDKAALEAVMELFKQRPEWWLPAVAKVGTRESHETVIYRVTIDQLTGRRASRGGA